MGIVAVAFILAALGSPGSCSEHSNFTSLFILIYVPYGSLPCSNVPNIFITVLLLTAYSLPCCHDSAIPKVTGDTQG